VCNNIIFISKRTIVEKFFYPHIQKINRRFNMRKKLLALFVLTTFLSSFVIKNANAETPFQADKFPYQDMQIQVMPEFDYPADWPKDTPSLLVGQYGTFTNKSGQDYSGNIEIPIPVNDKNFEPNLVAEFPDVNKSEVQRPYEINKDKGTISWKPGKAIKNNETYRYVIEYYTNSINVKDQKSFTYQFTNQAEVGTLDVVFYAPMNAKNIAMEPKAQSTSKSDYGEDLYYYEYKNVKAGNTLNYSFTYTKKGNESSLSVINKQQPPKDANHSGVNGKTTSASSTDNSKQPIIGVGGASIIGAAIIIAGLFIFFGFRGRKISSLSSSKSTKKHPAKPAAKKVDKLANSEEKKELRKKLLNGKIDQETYEEEMKKLI
jgi:hypothetical protein